MTIDKKMLRAMMHSPVRNYVVPGLTSWLIGAPAATGTVRFFECSREHQENITPHSHRFNFQCWVLSGQVKNKVWKRSYSSDDGDMFAETMLEYDEAIGRYISHPSSSAGRYCHTDTVYQAGEWYQMVAHEIHSIEFSAGAEVLFLEGPTRSNQSIILEPYVDGARVPTFKVEPWMFQRGAT